MMNLLYDDFPDSVVLNGTKRNIVTDFKDWLRFVDLLRDEECGPDDPFRIMLDFYLEEVPMQERAFAYDPLLAFFRMDETKKTAMLANGVDIGRRPKQLYDFRFDGSYIISGFWHDYRLDLTKAHMHWWKFRILLDGLSSETEFKQRVMYRNMDVSQIKEANERSRILRIQREIAIPQHKPDDFEIGDVFF